MSDPGAEIFDVCARIARSQAARQELAIVTRLYPREQRDVSNVVPLHPTHKEAPAPLQRPGA